MFRLELKAPVLDKPWVSISRLMHSYGWFSTGAQAEERCVRSADSIAERPSKPAE